MFSIGLSTSSGKSIDFGTDFCYGAIVSGVMLKRRVQPALGGAI